MNELYDSIKCLCDSPQRLRILTALNSTQLDLQSLMTELDTPLTPLQRNLSILKERGWIEDTRTGYTTTSVGCLILEKIVEIDETIGNITSIAPFLAAVDASTTLDIDKLRNIRVTEPSSAQPNAPMKRLLNVFERTDHVRGCLPVISHILIALSRCGADDDVSEHEYVVSQEVVEGLHKQYAADGRERSEMNLPVHIDFHISDDTPSYGLFIAQDRLALVAYNEIGRIQVLVESSSDRTITWGEHVYETYKQQSNPLMKWMCWGYNNMNGELILRFSFALLRC